MKEKFTIMTNNPMVSETLGEKYEIVYTDSSLPEFFEAVQEKICQGHILLTHPLSGSVKPGETPYKSVLISSTAAESGRFSEEIVLSVRLIENALATCKKFKMKPDRFGKNVLTDLQLIDYTLLKSAINSAETGA